MIANKVMIKHNEDLESLQNLLKRKNKGLLIACILCFINLELIIFRLIMVNIFSCFLN